MKGSEKQIIWAQSIIEGKIEALEAIKHGFKCVPTKQVDRDAIDNAADKMIDQLRNLPEAISASAIIDRRDIDIKIDLKKALPGLRAAIDFAPANLGNEIVEAK